METVNYDTEVKAYQFEPEVQVIIKKDSPGERAGLTVVFKKEVRKKHPCDCQQKFQIHLKKSIDCCEKQHLSSKFKPFKHFSILNFTMTKWFFRGTCFAMVFPVLLFSLKQFYVFIIK